MDFNSFLKKYNEEVESQVEEIKKIMEDGSVSVKDIISNEKYYKESLFKANVPPSYLIPSVSPAFVSIDDQYILIPNEGKWEYFNGHFFDDYGYGEESALMVLLTSIGLKRFVEILPEESICELKKILLDSNEV